MERLKIGLDRIVLYGFAIEDKDFEHLMELSKETGMIDINASYADDSWYIKIKDNDVFGDLILGRRMHGNRLIEYAYLSLTPTNAYGHNWDNMSWSEYDTYLEVVLQYIADQYHICLSTANMKIRGMEINCNIPLRGPYADYDRPIRLLMSLLPMHLGYSQSYTSRRKSTDLSPTYLHGNKSTSLKIYNKTAQMRNHHPNADAPQEPDCNQDIMRIELSLDTPEKIKSALGTNLWSDLNDFTITDYFGRCIVDTLHRKYAQWYTRRRCELTKLIRTMRRDHPKNWHHLTMQHIRNCSEMDGIPYILDIEQVAEAYRQLPDKNRNRTRAVRALMGIHIENDRYHHHDCEKIHEILEHLPASN